MYSPWAGVSGASMSSLSTSANPSTEVSGVRSSWLMEEKNTDLARFACRAASRASRRRRLLRERSRCTATAASTTAHTAAIVVRNIRVGISPAGTTLGGNAPSMVAI